MWREEHIANTLRLFGVEGSEVHAELDQYFHLFRYDHHVVMHHRKGVEYIREKLGDNAAKIAEQHIHDDFQQKMPEDYNDILHYRAVWAYDMDVFNEAKKFAENFFKGKE